jgi:aspartate aminotransferase
MNATKPVSLNLNVRGLEPSATLAINERCRALKQEGRDVCRLGLGQSPFPVPESVVQALRDSAAEKDYLPVKGLPSLREAVAEFHRREDLIDTQADGVLIGPGSKELMFLLQLTFYGEIMVTSPCWVSYVPQAHIVGRTVRVIPRSFAQGWKLSAAQLVETLETEADRFRPRLLVLNYPGNPTGQTYTPDELKEIADVARKFGLLILSDEIYGHLHHEGNHFSIARYYPEGTIVSSGLSKWCGAGGWRLGTFTFPPELDWLLDAMAAVASETYTSVSAPIQHAAVRAFSGGKDIDRYLALVRRILRTLGREVADLLSSVGANLQTPSGAFYLFADFSPLREKLAARGIHTGRQLTRRLLEETGVAILPGADFARDESELTARLAYVDFDGAAALAASAEIDVDEPLPADFTRTWCRSTVEGLERMANWLGEA